MKTHVIAADKAVRVPIADLVPHAMNARQGNVPMVAESLLELGQYRPIVVNKGTHTGRTNEILAGHHMTKAAAELGWETVAVNFVDVDDETAKKIMLADNRTSDAGTYDKRLLAELLGSLETFNGTGYAESDLDDLLKTIIRENPEELPDEGDAPSDDVAQTWGVLIMAGSEQEQVDLLTRFSTEGLNVRALI